MPDSKATLGAMANEIFELYRLIAAARSRQPSGAGSLSEVEFLTLDLLAKQQPRTIGEIQKEVGVLPAQMSRIIRALEQQGGRGYVMCKINPQDRRRIDVELTKAGTAAYDEFRASRIGSMLHILEALGTDDRTHFMRILRQLRETYSILLT